MTERSDPLGGKPAPGIEAKEETSRPVPDPGSIPPSTVAHLGRRRNLQLEELWRRGGARASNFAAVKARTLGAVWNSRGLPLLQAADLVNDAWILALNRQTPLAVPAHPSDDDAYYFWRGLIEDVCSKNTKRSRRREKGGFSLVVDTDKLANLDTTADAVFPNEDLVRFFHYLYCNNRDAASVLYVKFKIRHDETDTDIAHRLGKSERWVRYRKGEIDRAFREFNGDSAASPNGGATR